LTAVVGTDAGSTGAGTKVGTGWTAGTGSVGEPSALGLLGSKGVVIEGISYS
jgi:hypothetical protein